MKKAVFHYPEVFKTLPEYTAHAGQVVEVLGLAEDYTKDYTNDPDMESIYNIRAADGWTGVAYEGELEYLT